MDTLLCYKFFKKGEASNDHKVKIGCFCSKSLYNPFSHHLGLEVQYESSDRKSDTKYVITKNTNIKKCGDYGNMQVTKPDVKIVDLTVNDALQGFVY